MRVAVAWTSRPGGLEGRASGKVMSWGRRLPKGSQISEGLNRNRSEAEMTVTSTSPWSSLDAEGGGEPAELPPSTRTFLGTAIALPGAANPQTDPAAA